VKLTSTYSLNAYTCWRCTLHDSVNMNKLLYLCFALLPLAQAGRILLPDSVRSNVTSANNVPLLLSESTVETILSEFPYEHDEAFASMHKWSKNVLGGLLNDNVQLSIQKAHGSARSLLQEEEPSAESEGEAAPEEEAPAEAAPEEEAPAEAAEADTTPAAEEAPAEAAPAPAAAEESPKQQLQCSGKKSEGDTLEWESFGKVERFLGGDLEDPETFKKMVAARSYNCELIIIAANEGGTLMAANTILNFHRLGIDHYILLVRTQEHCTRLTQLQDIEISCAWSTYMKNHKALPKFGIGDCPHCRDAFRLWVARIRYLGHMIRAGLNAMYIDTDVTFTVNPYPAFKEKKMKDHNLILQLEQHSANGLNIGVMYCQNCAPNGRSQWVFDETINRIEVILDMDDPTTIWAEDVEQGIVHPPFQWQGAKNIIWDQHTLNDVTESSVTGKESRRRSYHIGVKGEERQKYLNAHGYKNPPNFDMNQDGVQSLPLLLPTDAPGAGETLVGAPTWLVGGWAGVAGDRSTQGVSGWWHKRAPPICHFVGCPDKGGSMKGLGWWDYKAESVAAADANAAHHDKAHEGTELTPVKHRQYLAITGLDLSFESLDAFNQGYTGKVMPLLLVLARLTGRHPVAPPVPCEQEASPWVTARSKECFNQIDQVPFRADWHKGERIHNGLMDGFCTPPETGAPVGSGEGDLCCFPWIGTVSARCSPFVYHFEMMRAKAEGSDEAVVKVDGEHFKTEGVTLDQLRKFVRRKERIVTLDLSDVKGVPTMDENSWTDDDIKILKSTMKSCNLLEKDVKKWYHKV